MAASFTDLYSFSQNTGMVVPDTSGIKQSVNNAMIDVFGSSVNLDNGTANGRFVDMLTRMFGSIVNVNAKNVNYMNLAYASGINLDTLASFFGVRRMGPTKTILAIEIYSLSDQTKLANGSVLQDYLGNQYILNCNPVAVGNKLYYGATCTAPTTIGGVQYYESYSATAVCTENGSNFPVFTNFEYTDTFRSNALLTLVSAADGSENVDDIMYIEYNGNAGCFHGSDSESDMLLRSRLSRCRDFGSGTAQSIANAIWAEFPDLKRVSVADDTSSRSVKVMCSGISSLSYSDGNLLSQEDQYRVRKRIAEIIYNKKPAGISIYDTTYSSGSGSEAIPTINRYVDTGTGIWPSFLFLGTRESIYEMKVTDMFSGISNKVCFYEPRSTGLSFRIDYSLNGYEGDDVRRDILNALCGYVGSAASPLNSTKCISAISSMVDGVFITSLSMKEFGGSSTLINFNFDKFRTIPNVTEVVFNEITNPS